MTDAEKIKKLQVALEDAGKMQRELEQALASAFPGEDWAVAQLQQGSSIIERSMKLRLHTHRQVIVDTK